MSSILGLLASAGVTFGIQNKIPFLHGKHPFLDSMLGCTYCTGFHAGWMVWLLMNISVFSLPSIVIFAFASAIFCYALDEFIKYLEESNQQE